MSDFYINNIIVLTFINKYKYSVINYFDKGYYYYQRLINYIVMNLFKNIYVYYNNVFVISSRGIQL